MRRRKLRSPEKRVGTLGNTALPPPGEEDPPSTEVLLHRALVQGDDRALEAAVHDLRPEMLRIATGHVRSIDDAEDVVQDTWIAAFSAIDRFQGRASLRTWLFRILTYRARSAGRRRSRFVPISQLTPGTGTVGESYKREPLLISSPTDPAKLVVARDLRNRVERALGELPSRQREVVRLRDLEGWTPEEACTRLGVSAGNQRVLLHRGRLQLRKLVVH